MLNRKLRYLQIALNSTLPEAKDIIGQLPVHERIILEAGTPLIKEFGAEAIRKIKFWWENRISTEFLGQPSPKTTIDLGKMFIDAFVSPKKGPNQRPKITKAFEPYIVADLKCMDRGEREVRIAKEAGASAVVALGQAPVETIEAFIAACEKYSLDSMVDMMNVEQPIKVLRRLKKLPTVVVLHRGVDEETFNPDKPIPYVQINKVKASYNTLIAIAGGDTIREVQRAIFNGADIVVVWKEFYQPSSETGRLAREFLKEIK